VAVSHASAARQRVAPPACRIEAVRAESMLVAVAGECPFAGAPDASRRCRLGAGPSGPFTVSVSDGSLVLAPTDDPRRLEAEVEHPFRFRASAPVDEQRLMLTERAELAAGAVRTAPEMPVLALSTSDHGLVGELQLGRRAPTRGLEAIVGPLPLSCDAIAATSDPEPETTTALLTPPIGGELRIATTLPLAVRPFRAAPIAAEVRPRERAAFLPVWIIDRQDDAARVVIAFSDGSEVRGWVDASALREASETEEDIASRMIGTPAETETIRHGLLGGMESLTAPPEADEQIGPAVLRPGSAIFASPGGALWAHNADTPLEVRVRWDRSSRYAELLEVPGIWITPQRAYVRRSELSIPTQP
jgi:hypothetical protein